VRLIGLVQSENHVCCRYRLAAFRALLSEAGHSLELRPWPRHWYSWLRLGRELKGADAVILQRRLLQRWQLFLLRRAARRLIFDFDDAVFLRDSFSRKSLYSGSRMRRFAATVQAADAVVAGNGFLAQEAARWGEVGRVHVIPTCVDPARYPASREQRPASTFQLVWVGSSSTLQGLEVIAPMLNELGERIPELRLKLICDRFLALRLLPVLPCPWSEATEAAEIAAADIGISWVPDDLWSRGKCGLKVLQYMAAGLPVVANPVSVHPEIIRHGESGFLASTPSEWQEAISQLVRDPELRRRMGLAGRRRLEEAYSVATGAAAWKELLAGLVRSRQAA
jgi:glycosyltransferase involved in cell wall biosynthesis